MLNNKARIAVLVSGGGTNLQALIDAEKSGIIKSGKIVLVISSKADAYALTRAKNAGIDVAIVARKECKDTKEFESKITDKLGESPVVNTVFLRRRFLRFESTRSGA